MAVFNHEWPPNGTEFRKIKLSMLGLFVRFFSPIMKNDTTTSLLTFVLAILVVAGVVFAYLTMTRTSALRKMQPILQNQLQSVQVVSGRAQALLGDVITYNNTAKSPELQQIIQFAQTPAQPAAK
jgi:hypothetical protein